MMVSVVMTTGHCRNLLDVIRVRCPSEYPADYLVEYSADCSTTSIHLHGDKNYAALVEF